MSSKASTLRKQVAVVRSQLEENFIQRRLLEHKHSPEGKCYAEELRDVVPLLMEREQQLRELADASAEVLDGF